MNSSEACLGRTEAQRSTDTYEKHWIQRYNPISLIMRGLCYIFGLLGCCEAGGDTEPLQDFLTDNNIFSDIFNLPDEYEQMTPEIFTAVSAGKKECLATTSSWQIARLKDDQGDSVLHLATSWGNVELVKSFVSKCPSLLLKPNSKDQLPLHVAAHAGQLSVVEALVATVTFVSATLSDEQDKKRLKLYVVKDKDGNTPLHLALKGGHVSTAVCLVKANQGASFLADNDGISPLYMAVRVGNVLLVKEMLKDTPDNSQDLGLEGNNFLAHAALKARNTDILDCVHQKCPRLLDVLDEEGMSCLSVGASIGFNRGVRNLLNRSENKVYVSNNDGSFPIHIAMKRRHIYLVSEILKYCPESKYLLNRKGQNILHIAASSGKMDLYFFSYLLGAAARSIFLRDGRFSRLMEKQDVDGNTPLHLATMNWRPRTIFCLLCHYNRKCMATRNNSGLTALDIAEGSMHPNYIFRERVSLLVLLYFYVTSRGFFTRKMFTEKITKPSYPLDADKNKDYVNTLLVVSALVATVTFAAGFTIPGGFNSSGPNSGRATLAVGGSVTRSQIFKYCDLAFTVFLSTLHVGCILLWRLGCICACYRVCGRPRNHILELPLSNAISPWPSRYHTNTWHSSFIWSLFPAICIVCG
ncbi:protein ACCELERATED CELL DEATH 6 isoform X2 [Brassica rapa]|uniref:protein ACCELERATED CELL DEATH 6 isoform X2 n=1 Tax=Brassica campestris TaxID=3711 RepID=UPI000871B7E3|nr:protein ACCELERATED CELL DEATH 6 isoform X2 [Brassica rapa]